MRIEVGRRRPSFLYLLRSSTIRRNSPCQRVGAALGNTNQVFRWFVIARIWGEGGGN